METKKIVVIGGGMSGLAATQRLLHHGFKNVILLEGSNRLGGRIHTVQHDAGTLEMGAQWIHGEIGNPIFKLAKKHGLLYTSTNKQEDEEESSYKFYTPDGCEIPEEVVDETSEIIDNMIKEAEDLIDKRHELSLASPSRTVNSKTLKPLKKHGSKKRVERRISENQNEEIALIKKELSEIRTLVGRSRSVSGEMESDDDDADDDEEIETESMGSFLRTTFKAHLNRTKPSPEVRSWKKALFDWRMKYEKTENACPTMDDVSFAAWNDYVLPRGDDSSELGRKGYGAILSTIIKDIPDTTIRLNTHVDRIEWQNKNGNVQIKCGNSVIVADHVILTSSLGYLKKHHQDFFYPVLPSNKQRAIERLGFGTVDKMFLLFKEPFWEDSCDGFQFAWTPNSRVTMPCQDTNNEKPWFKAIHGFDTIYQHDNILEGWIAGIEAEMYEPLEDETVLNVGYELLRTFLNRKDIPKPSHIIRSKWFSNKYACGSYSYRRIGSSAQDCKCLAFPLPSRASPVLMFAGEATHEAFYSTTHGAYLSGQREADRLHQLYNINPTKYKNAQH